MVGDLVWATMRGHPPWPAKVITGPEQASIGQRKCKVILFGTQETALMNESDLCDYEANADRYEHPRKIPDFNKGIQAIRRAANLPEDDRFREKPRTPSPIAHALANIQNGYDDYGLGDLDPQQPSTSNGRRRRISGLTLSVVDELIASNRIRTNSNASRRSRASSICSNARKTLQNARWKAQQSRVRNPDSISSVSGGSNRSRRSRSRFDLMMEEDPLFTNASDPHHILDADMHHLDLLDDKKNIALLDNQSPAICDSFLLDKPPSEAGGRVRNSSISSQIFGRQRLLSGMSDVLGFGSGDDLLDLATGPGSDHDAEMHLFRAFDAMNGELERAPTPEEPLAMPVINKVKCSACGCECQLVNLKWRCTSSYCQTWNGAYMPDGAQPITKQSFQFRADDQGSVSGASTHGMSSCEQAVIMAAAGSDPLYRGALNNAQRLRAISTSSSHGPGAYMQQPARNRLSYQSNLMKKEESFIPDVPKPVIVSQHDLPSTSGIHSHPTTSMANGSGLKKRKTVQIDPMVGSDDKKAWNLADEEEPMAEFEKGIPIPTIRIAPATSRPTESQRKQQEQKQAAQKKKAQPVVNIRRPYGSGRPKSYDRLSKVEKTPPVGENGQRHCAFCNGQVRPQMCGGNKHRWRCVDKKCRKWYGWVRSNEEIPKDLGKKGRWKDLQLKIRRKRANSAGTDDGSIYNKPDGEPLPKRPATTFRPVNGTKKTVKKHHEEDDEMELIDKTPLSEKQLAFVPSLMQRRARWWLSDKKRQDMSPEREVGHSVLDTAATFRLISNSMRTAASTKADQVGTVPGSLDLLMDSLMASLGPLMSLAMKIPGVRIPEELGQRFWKSSLPHIPII
ncbi:hypothetical protein L596_009698 [Steinernema carpocapsae]|uniref:PWWP domain-containing protein n=1 Tax=Steinernema carpocapsae TaxID=34508 RepID=A0A4U5PGM2_STECR|nr:hypothetical protein L596_009698 [Steinernema carpocapsae]